MRIYYSNYITLYLDYCKNEKGLYILEKLYTGEINTSKDSIALTSPPISLEDFVPVMHPFKTK